MIHVLSHQNFDFRNCTIDNVRATLRNDKCRNLRGLLRIWRLRIWLLLSEKSSVWIDFSDDVGWIRKLVDAFENLIFSYCWGPRFWLLLQNVVNGRINPNLTPLERFLAIFVIDRKLQTFSIDIILDQLLTLFRLKMLFTAKLLVWFSYFMQDRLQFNHF